MNLKQELANPAIKYRPIPFWSWNDKLETDELRYQVNQMKDVGIGGYFMHARGGLLTDYMGDEWFDCIKACVDEGREIGMNSWAYDENGWPSGFGDGLVNGLGVKYQQKYLRIKQVKASEIADSDHTIAYFSLDGTQVLDNPSEDSEVLYCYYDVNQYYVDTLDGEVTRTFIEKIYQKYYDSLSSEEWQNMAGFFTDEPQVSRNGIPWSFIIKDEYEKAYGEALLPLLPQLMFEVSGFERTRYRFWKLVTNLFMNNFMKPIYDWCEEHDCQVTGHHVLEETYHSQITSNGAIMPQYQYYHIPGMDWLCRKIKPITTPVQVASVCAQLGKKQILSETFALCGWNVKIEELKWMYQWQMVHGINLLCQHLESYSLKGIRKRDYPASLFLHQPWWKDYRTFNDYVSRIGVLLAEGEIKTDTLILHGQSSAWICFNNNDQDVINSYFESFNQLSELLDSAHLNYHYGDETMIEMHGSVEGNEFVIGKQRYKTVIVPQLRNLSSDVFQALQQFIKNGGTVLAVKNSVEEVDITVDGQLCSSVSELTDAFTWFESEQDLADNLHSFASLCPVVPVHTAADDIGKYDSQLSEINYTKRCFTDLNGSPAELFYFVNNDLNKGYDAEIYLAGQAVEQFNPEIGEFKPVFAEKAGDKLRIPHFFAPAGDLILVVRSESSANIAEIDYSRKDPAALASANKQIDLNGDYDIALTNLNILTLDYCSYWFEDELQEEHGYILNIQDRMLKLKRPVDLKMEFSFNIGDNYNLASDLFLVMEIPDKFDILVNDQEIHSEDCGYVFDKAFRKLPISSAVKKGKNSIQLKTRFSQPDNVYKCLEAAKIFEAEKNKLSYAMEIEAIYLYGDFGVQVAGEFEPLEREAVRCNNIFELTSKPVKANLAKVHEADLPFFAGSVKLSREFNIEAGQDTGRYLVCDHQKAIVSKISINGQELPAFLWKPFTADLNGILKAGTNRIEIELTNSLRNMLGPHHISSGESYAVGPSSFHKEPGVFGSNWDGSATPWNDNYCIVEFGLEGLTIV